MLKYLSTIFKQEGGNEENSAILDAIGNSLDQVNEDTDLIVDEMSIKRSTSTWLDKWASWFGIARTYGEVDISLRKRVLNVLTDATVTIPAIVEMTKRILGDDTIVVVYEPYHDVRFFNVSTFSGKGKYEDDEYYRVGVIDVIVNKPVTDDLINAITLIKGGGIHLKFTYNPAEIVDVNESTEPLSFTLYLDQVLTQERVPASSLSGTSRTKFSGGKNIWSKIE